MGLPIWFQIETEANSGFYPWQKLFSPNHRLNYPIISTAKSIWCKLHRTGRWDFVKSPSAPFWNNKNILIGGTPVDWAQWRKAGTLHIFHLFETKHFLSFDQIFSKYILPCNQLWR